MLRRVILRRSGIEGVGEGGGAGSAQNVHVLCMDDPYWKYSTLNCTATWPFLHIFA